MGETPCGVLAMSWGLRRHVRRAAMHGAAIGGTDIVRGQPFLAMRRDGRGIRARYSAA